MVDYGNADSRDLLAQHFSEQLLSKFEIFSYRNAVSVLSGSFPDQFAQLLSVLCSFEITTTMMRTPGGSKGPIARYVDDLFSEDWSEVKITADLDVKLFHARNNAVLGQYKREGYLDGHRIDFVNGKVALDLEWNSKDQTYDRDLFAFSAFYEAGAIDVGIVLTRGSSLNNDYFCELGKVLDRDGKEGKDEVVNKYGASTTWMGKLLPRLEAGRNGGCPILAIGITPRCVVE